MYVVWDIVKCICFIKKSIYLNFKQIRIIAPYNCINYASFINQILTKFAPNEAERPCHKIFMIHYYCFLPFVKRLQRSNTIISMAVKVIAKLYLISLVDSTTTPTGYSHALPFSNTSPY